VDAAAAAAATAAAAVTVRSGNQWWRAPHTIIH